MFSRREMVWPHSCVPTYVKFVRSLKVLKPSKFNILSKVMDLLMEYVYAIIILLYRAMSSTGNHSKRSYYVYSGYDG